MDNEEGILGQQQLENAIKIEIPRAMTCVLVAPQDIASINKGPLRDDEADLRVRYLRSNPQYHSTRDEKIWNSIDGHYHPLWCHNVTVTRSGRAKRLSIFSARVSPLT